MVFLIRLLMPSFSTECWENLKWINTSEIYLYDMEAYINIKII